MYLLISQCFHSLRAHSPSSSLHFIPHSHSSGIVFPSSWIFYMTLFSSFSISAFSFEMWQLNQCTLIHSQMNFTFVRGWDNVCFISNIFSNVQKSSPLLAAMFWGELILQANSYSSILTQLLAQCQAQRTDHSFLWILLALLCLHWQESPCAMMHLAVATSIVSSRLWFSQDQGTLGYSPLYHHSWHWI